ncbi:MAG: DinB family protein [Ginsengibacter sp.]
MKKQSQKIKKFRLFLLNQISSLTTEQLNVIPRGFNNNIIWNLGHLVSSAQIICYRRAGLPISIDEKFLTPFLPNTKPGKFISNEEIEILKELLISTIDCLQSDYENKIFDNYTKSENIERYYGVELLTIDDALDFLLYHEGFHSGRIIALKQLV